MAKQKLMLNRLGEILKERGVKNQFLANKLHLTKTSISSYVTNTHQPSLETLYQIATLLNIPVTELLNPDMQVYPKDEPRKQKRPKKAE